MDGNLIFGSANQPQGFLNLAMAKWDGNPEPIVREMLQNCLDAAVEANRAAGEVWFTIRRVAVEAIPGIEAYREQFQGAVREREKGKQGGAERRVVKRIQRVVTGPDIQVLFCRDNGIGLNADRMKRILTEGNTDKSEVGAGAFGIGHLTAFAASDLRFIHYAGRSRCDGILRDVASAHAVLASRTVDRNSGRGAHGFWLLGDDRTLFHPHPYPNAVPHLLRSEIECLEDTGSVVGVIGFNGFRSDEKPVDAISRVAAKNFLVAIWNGSMVVHIRDETTSSEETVDRERLERILDRERNRRRAEQGGGWLSGEQAYRAWKTLETGRKLRFEEDGVSGYFRSLSDGPKLRARSRVQFFRNGMWITNEADRLLPRDFNGFKPFDAILEIDSGAFGDLLRGAEGPEHRGLERRRLGRRGSRKLLDKLKELAARLREEAGRVEQSEEFTPTGFALFRGDAEREAEKVPPYRPRRSPVEMSAAEGGQGEESTPQPDTEGGSVDRTPGPGPKPRRPRRFTPKPGRSIRGRCSVRAVADADGQLRQLRVMWRPARGAERSSDNLVVRVRVPSGSDETCVHPIGPRWLRISELHHNGEVSDPQDGGFEVELPRGEDPFTIMLADRIPDANAVEVDVVGRRPAVSEGG